jgi:hypothetical protein
VAKRLSRSCLLKGRALCAICPMTCTKLQIKSKIELLNLSKTLSCCLLDAFWRQLCGRSANSDHLPLRSAGRYHLAHGQYAINYAHVTAVAMSGSPVVAL